MYILSTIHLYGDIYTYSLNFGLCFWSLCLAWLVLALFYSNKGQPVRSISCYRMIARLVLIRIKRKQGIKTLVFLGRLIYLRCSL